MPLTVYQSRLGYHEGKIKWLKSLPSRWLQLASDAFMLNVKHLSDKEVKGLKD